MKKYFLSLVLLFFSSSVFAIAVQDIPKRVYDDATESYKVKVVSSIPTASDTAGLATEAKQDATINLLTSLDNKYGTAVVLIDSSVHIVGDTTVQLDSNIVYVNNNNVFIADTGVELKDTAVYLPDNEIKIISIKSFSNSVFAETSAFASTSFIGFDLGDTYQKITIATDTSIIWNTTGSGAGSQVFANSVDVESIEIKTVYIKLKNAGTGYITVRGVKE